MIRAVIFDIDNTLYDYDNCHASAMNALQTFSCQKYHITANEFLRKFDKSKDIVKNQLGDTASSHNRMLYMQLFLEQICQKPASGALELYDIYWDTILRQMEPYPYVIPLMQELKRNNITIGVLTDLTAHIQHRKLRNLGLTEYIDILVTSEEAGVEKPSPIIFKKLLDKLSPISPNEVLMIGDSEIKDTLGAKAAGMIAIRFAPTDKSDMFRKAMEYINEKYTER